MKGVFLKSFTLMILLIFFEACSIPGASFTFINNATNSAVITPAAGQDWSGFTLGPSQTHSIVSQSSNIFFSALLGTQEARLHVHFTYDSSTRTYTFH